MLNKNFYISTLWWIITKASTPNNSSWTHALHYNLSSNLNMLPFILGDAIFFFFWEGGGAKLDFKT